MISRSTAVTAVFLIASACGPRSGVHGPADTRLGEDDAPGKKVVQPPVDAVYAPSESPRLDRDVMGPLPSLVESWFAGHIGRRIYIQLDKPIYKPGETIWVKTWDVKARDLSGDHGNNGIRYELVNPRGAVAQAKQVQETHGMGTNDFQLAEGIEGGQYTLRVTTYDGHTTSRPLVVSAYEAPRLKKKLEFVRKAYGAGDEVTATIKVERPTGEPMKNHPLRGVVVVDGATLDPVAVRTNAAGGALVRFTMPGKIERGDGLLTVLVEDGGITESISKRIPIIVNKLQFSLFPEGGKLVSGVPGRVYFEAKTPIGKPADVEGRVVDDQGSVVAEFRSYKFGLGRFEMTAAPGRRYHAEIAKPVGINAKYPLPVAADSGCSLQNYDDYDGQVIPLRVAVRCSDDREVIVVGMLRENLIDAAAVKVTGGDPAVVYLRSDDDALNHAQGIARVTVFDDAQRPLAERLIFRNRRRGLTVEVTPDEESYAPRDQVALTVRTRDSEGNPVSAAVALSVVDDTVVSFADDKTGHMLSRLFLEPEIPGDVEEPNFFFDLTEKKSAVAMDLLMGTRGWRTFEWQAVLAPPPPESTASVRSAPAPDMAPEMARVPQAAPRPADKKAKGQARRPRPSKPAARRPRPPAAPKVAAKAPPPAPARARRAPPPPAAQPRMERVAAPEVMAEEAPAEAWGGEDEAMMEDRDMAFGAGGMAIAPEPQPMFAPVRVFPAPTYTGTPEGPRTDFRDTIYWAPAVETDGKGKAIVTFYLSDAITSFRVFSEAVGDGKAGRSEKVFKSSLPFSMAVKLPLEVSAGDRIQVPLTLTNDRDESLGIELETEFGDLVRLEEEVAGLDGALPGGSRRSLFYPLRVKNGRGKTKVRFAADASGLKDEFVRELNVVPVGFPQNVSASGTLTKTAKFELDIASPLQGTMDGSLTLYGSPVATLMGGMEGMLREPGGCFEQTSSSNYPNVMIMQYLKAHDAAKPELLGQVSGMLDRGYKRLVGFETPKKGYEWFGQSPPHEALTAYGVLEFADMKRVYGNVDDAMITRTVRWLQSRRDGKGGYLRDAKALDSFGRADPEVTNAYITWAMSEAGFSDMQREIEAQAAAAKSEKDPYRLALATNTLLNIPATKKAGQAAAKRLAGMQEQDGSWKSPGHSITRSTGQNLTIETTAIATTALMKLDGYRNEVRRAAKWLHESRNGYGSYGATQATVLALRALTEYADYSRVTQSAGSIAVRINGRQVSELKYEAGQDEPITMGSLGRYLVAGTNVIELEHDGKSELPFAAALDYRTRQPNNHPGAVVRLSTDIERTELKMGETVRVTARVENVTDQGQPMTLARVGLPGGLTFQNWQLKDLKEEGKIAFYETLAREVILYFRDMKPNEVKEIPLDLVATVPGSYTGPASRAYLYYTNDQKVWAEPLKVVITP